jgi:hypothetical protein
LTIVLAKYRSLALIVNQLKPLSSLVLVGFLLGNIFKKELATCSLVCASFLSG